MTGGEVFRENMERTLAEFPVCEYAFVEIPEIPFREEVRYICRTECPRYGTSWSCPPAVGTVKECEARCAGYDGALIFTTIAEDVDTEDMSAMLATRMEHEEVTRQIRARMAEDVTDTLVLSTESCAICEHCAYPAGPCRHPDRMFPCIESYGILVTELAERHDITFLSGSRLVTWFSLILYKL
ncbi:DUF2284 domain-containing protein [Anaerosacchariphilus sp. NSJ-68]|uniref:DUF2284 domain-containing protein n=3 Tax=Lachnospirales TaxID=3085636 RepID=A0A923LCP8_9FIRM|nr:DUF2284 domain-containing protein [Anaerosacchariphilus hominis]MBC5697530.1 DUF2284 domain-containing protein [Roseburia difficilis]